MDWSVIVALSVVQGATEFLPVSSSGHLALFQHCFRMPEEMMLPLTVALHFGTILAPIAYFRDDLQGMIQGILGREGKGRKLLAFILIADGTTVPIALLLEGSVKKAFEAPLSVAFSLAVTALFLFIGEKVAMRPGRIERALSWKIALWVGLIQGFAVFPGISRSGATIFAGLVAGLSRDEAGRFAFLVGIPIMVGATLWEAKEIVTLPISPVLLGAAVLLAALVGYGAIGIALWAVRNLRLRWFGIYCLTASLLTAFLARFGS